MKNSTELVHFLSRSLYFISNYMCRLYVFYPINPIRKDREVVSLHMLHSTTNDHKHIISAVCMWNLRRSYIDRRIDVGFSVLVYASKIKNQGVHHSPVYTHQYSTYRPAMLILIFLVPDYKTVQIIWLECVAEIIITPGNIRHQKNTSPTWFINRICGEKTQKWFVHNSNPK